MAWSKPQAYHRRQRSLRLVMQAAEPPDFGARRVGPCKGCGVILPLLWPPADRLGDTWACVKCGRRHYAIIDPEASPEERARVRRAR